MVENGDKLLNRYAIRRRLGWIMFRSQRAAPGVDTWFVMNSDGSSVQRLAGRVSVLAKPCDPWRAVISQ